MRKPTGTHSSHDPEMNQMAGPSQPQGHARESASALDNADPAACKIGRQHKKGQAADHFLCLIGGV